MFLSDDLTGQVSSFALLPQIARELGLPVIAAEASGRGDFSSLWSGQNASGCRAVGAAELTRELAAKL